MNTMRLALILLFSPGGLLAASPGSDAGSTVAALAVKAEGKVFGRGECWDFVAAVLDAAKCEWARPLDFGRRLDLKKEALAPGDILQFESVRIEWRRGDRFGTIRLGFPQHFGVVLSARESVVVIAHQNYNQTRPVSRLALDLREVKAGKVLAFRPMKKAG